MHNLSYRKAVVSIALSIVFSLTLCSSAFATPVQSGSPFNTYNLSNRSEAASAAVAEAGHKRLDNVIAGLASNALNSLTLTVDEDNDIESVESFDENEVPDSVLRAMSCLGVPYVSGSSSPSGFDCSGLVSYALTGQYCHAYTSYSFWAMPEVDDPQPGDVVACSPGHCGLYIGDGQMIHAPHSGTVVSIEAVRGKIVRP